MCLDLMSVGHDILTYRSICIVPPYCRLARTVYYSFLSILRAKMAIIRNPVPTADHTYPEATVFRRTVWMNLKHSAQIYAYRLFITRIGFRS